MLDSKTNYYTYNYTKASKLVHYKIKNRTNITLYFGQSGTGEKIKLLPNGESAYSWFTILQAKMISLWIDDKNQSSEPITMSTAGATYRTLMIGNSPVTVWLKIDDYGFQKNLSIMGTHIFVNRLHSPLEISVKSQTEESIYKLENKEEQCMIFADGTPLQLKLRATTGAEWSQDVAVSGEESLYSIVNLPLTEKVQTRVWTQLASSSQKERPSIVVIWPFCVFNNQTGLDLQLRKADGNHGNS